MEVGRTVSVVESFVQIFLVKMFDCDVLRVLKCLQNGVAAFG